jgi:hypothetical protein
MRVWWALGMVISREERVSLHLGTFALHCIVLYRIMSTPGFVGRSSRSSMNELFSPPVVTGLRRGVWTGRGW